MSGYEMNEKDIAAIMRLLAIHDSEDASRESAIRLLEYMHERGKGIANSKQEFIDSFLEELTRKKRQFKNLEKKLEDEKKNCKK